MRSGKFLFLITLIMVSFFVIMSCEKDSEEDNTATNTKTEWSYTEPETLEEFSGSLDIFIGNSGHVSAYPKDFRSLCFYMCIDLISGRTPDAVVWEKIQLRINPEKLQMADATLHLISVRFQLNDLNVILNGNWNQIIEPENIKILKAVFRPGVEAILVYRPKEGVNEQVKVVELTNREVEAIQTVMDFYEFWTT